MSPSSKRTLSALSSSPLSTMRYVTRPKRVKCFHYAFPLEISKV